MFNRLKEKWGVGPWQLFTILWVFAITGTATAWITGKITSWVNFNENTWRGWQLLLRMAMLVIGYQLILLTVAFLMGQFPFFWRFEKKLLHRLGLINKDKNKTEQGKETNAMNANPKPKTQKPKLNIAVFASGTGTNADAIIQYFQGSPAIGVALLVCNKPGAGALAKAENAGVPALLIEKERFFRGDAYLPELQAAGIDFVVLAGFLWKVPQALIDAYRRRIVNIHPALLPKYGGKGMYGKHVHETVILNGEVESGISIHYVDEHYDSGDIIFQTACPVLPGDTATTLAARIHQLEHLHYPRVIEEVIESAGRSKDS